MIAKETEFPIGKAHLYFKDNPRYPRNVSDRTVAKWANEGVVSNRTGQRVFLKTTQVGGNVFTSHANYEQFIRDLNGENLQGGGQ